jgi:hypothetical protein
MAYPVIAIVTDEQVGIIFGRTTHITWIEVIILGLHLLYRLYIQPISIDSHVGTIKTAEWAAG